MNVEVHVDWQGRTHLVGRLYPAERSAAVSFEYDASWLGRAERFAIDPTSLPLRRGVQHGATLFGVVQDCGPDRWGRLLIARAVRKKVLAQKPFGDLDYVLALDDATRLGALRFRPVAADGGGPYLAAIGGKLPPLVRLSALLHAADAIHRDTETAADLRFLLGAGSTLGGARPKSAVSLDDGRLALAKFPKPDDTRDIAAGEILTLTLAREAGITVADHRLVRAGTKSVAVITRFDRTASGERIPFISASSLLALPTDDPGSYTLLADGVRQFGDQVTADLRELWRRLLFSLLVSNYDDHLRNHGFLMHTAGRWSLSPAYDLNPVPEVDRVRSPETPIAEDQDEPTVAAAIQAAPRFGLKTDEARTMLREVFAVVGHWREVGIRLRLKATTLDAYESAFENPLMQEAGKLLGRS